MSILFNQFTSLDEIAGHLPDVAPPFAGIDSDTAIIGDPHWRRGFFMALQAAQFYCPPDHPMIALAEWLLDVGWEPMWRDNGSGSPLGMAGGDSFLHKRLRYPGDDEDDGHDRRRDDAWS